MSHRAVVLLLALGLGSTLALPFGCERRDEAPPTVVDPTLLAFLSRARASHHQADLLEAERREDEAQAALSALIDGPLPPQALSLAEVREVLADTLARRAELRGRLGHHDDAIADVRRGLELAPETSYFEGHLHEVLGLIEEQRSVALERELASRLGDGESTPTDPPPPPDPRVEQLRREARAARERALAAFARAVAIQARVIEQALPNAAASPGPTATPGQGE